MLSPFNKIIFALSLSEAIKKELVYPLMEFISLEEMIKMSSWQMGRIGLLKKNREFEGMKTLEKKADEVIKQCEEKGISISTVTSESYPRYLENIYFPPLAIYYQGVLRKYLPKEGFYLAFIGSRRSDKRMNEFSEKIAYEFSLWGGHIISGLAKGIDTFSHRGACRAGKPNTGVVANGLDYYYPFVNRGLYRDILDRNGCLISEYPPGSKPLEYRFPLRNRIISALSEGIFVIQSPKKSGTKITVNYGLEAGKNIYTYDITSLGEEDIPEIFMGNKELLDSGAIPIKDVDDFLEKIKTSPSYLLLKTITPLDKDLLLKNKIEINKGNSLEENLLRLAKDGPKSLNEMSNFLKVGSEDLSNIVLDLVFSGKLKELANKKYYST